MKIHLTFHVSLIEKAFQNAKIYALEVKNEIEYKVKKILK